MTWHLIDEADAELRKAENRYDAIDPRLGAEFTQQVLEALEDICARPNLSPLIHIA